MLALLICGGPVVHAQTLQHMGAGGAGPDAVAHQFSNQQETSETAFSEQIRGTSLSNAASDSAVTSGGASATTEGDERISTHGKVRGGTASFTAVGAGLTGVQASSSSVADVDGDGNPDLLITGEDSSGTPTATLYLGDGNGGFTEANADLTGVYRSSSSVADVNGDGNPDLLITGEDSGGTPTATLYLGDGNGGFTEANADLTGASSSSSSIADIDGDGNPDLLIAGDDGSFNGGRVEVYLGDGNGGFTEAGADLTGVAFGSSTSIADVDGDGNEDLLVTGSDDNSNDTATLYLGDGNGDFTEANAGLTGVSGSSSSVADVDGDGNEDLFITGYDGPDDTATLYLGDGTGGFTEAGAGLTGVRNGSTSIADVDEDGKLDLIITGSDANNDRTTTLYLGDGSGGFRESGAGLADVSGSSTSITDVDGDGAEDLLITGRDTNDNQRATVYRNDGDTTAPDTPSSLTASATAANTTTVSWTASDSADVDTYRIYRDTAPIDSSAGPGSYTPLDSTAAGDTTLIDTSGMAGQRYYYRVTAVDSVSNESSFSGEASAVPQSEQPPLAITGLQPESGTAGTPVRIRGAGFSGTASGNSVTFGGVSAAVDSATSTIIYAEVPSGVEGPVDVSVSAGGATVTGSKQFTVVTGGTASFASVGAGLTGVGQIAGSSSSIADVNRDGNQDLLVTGYDGSTRTATLYLGDGSGGFTEANAGLTGVSNGSTSIADVDGDGNLDLLITGDNSDSSANPTTTLYLGDGTGGFMEAGAALTSVQNSSSSIADVDGDGSQDLLITGEDSSGTPTATLYLGDGTGGFTEAGAGLTGVDEGSTSIADVNEDGNPDLLITGLSANSGPATTLYLGDGNGDFTEAGAGLTGVENSSSSVADVNGDGNEDLLITGRDPVNIATATLYLGDGSGSFAKAGAVLNEVSLGSTSIADVDGDGNEDLLITGYDGPDDTATLYLGDGTGGFTEAGAGLTGVRNGSTSIADVYGDGKLDLIITGSSGGTPTATLYRNGDTAVPDAVKSLTATAAPDTVSLTWSASDSPDVTRYRVYRDTASIDSVAGPSGLAAYDSTAAGDTTLVDTSGMAGQRYYYRVTAVDSASNESSFSPEASAAPETRSVSIAEARGKGIGSTVTVEGTVTRAFGDFVRFQDESGPTGASGLVVQQASDDSLAQAFQDDIADGTITRGTRLQVTGTVSAFSGLLWISRDSLETYTVEGQGEPPAPQVVSLSDIQAPGGEDYESELLKVEGLSFPGASGTFEGGTTYTAENTEGASFDFRVQGPGETNLIGEPIPEGTFVYRGVLGQFNALGDPSLDEGYQFLPVRPSDVKTANLPPTLATEIPDDTVKTPGPPLRLTGLTQTVFSDPDGGGLDISATSASSSVLQVRAVGPAGVTLEPQQAGETQVSVTATDLEGAATTDTFRVVVRGRPEGEGVPESQGQAVVGPPDADSASVSLGASGIEAKFRGIRSSGTAEVSFFLDSPVQPSGLSKASVPVDSFESVSSYRWEITEQDIDFDSVDLAFSVDSVNISSLGEPETISIIKDSEGDGDFEVLPTTYDDRGTPSDSTDDVLIAKGVAEFSTFRTATSRTSGSENSSPVAEVDSFSVPEDSTLVVEAPGVLGNDSDPDGDSLSASLVSSVSDGDLTLRSDGSFEYSPNQGFTGMDQFEYEASDGNAADTVGATVEVKKRGEPFITTWETTSPDSVVTIPTDTSDSDYDFVIDWGDGTTETYAGPDPDPSHSYNSAGTYAVEINGTFPRIYLNAGFGGGGDQANALRLRSIEQWGSIQWESMSGSFLGASNLSYNATDTPDLSNVFSIAFMFGQAQNFNGDIGDWDVSGVFDMVAVFAGAENFNQDIGAWDVSGASAMSFMFFNAESFNQDISGWDVSGVLFMDSMFSEADNFNQDIGPWQTGNATDMAAMFSAATSFNQDIGGWDVSSVNDMAFMFADASSFDQDIGSWNVSSVTDMHGMFSGATSFDQDLSLWDVTSVDDSDPDLKDSFENFLSAGAGLSLENYDALLSGWAELDLTDGLTFDAGQSQYTSAAADARQSIIDSEGWTIRDGGRVSFRPTGISARASGTEVALRWDRAGDDGGVGLSGHNVYRSVSPFSEKESATKLNASPIGEVTYVDAEVSSGARYYYRVTAVGASGAESALSPEATVALPPETVQAEAQVSFGEAGDPEGYRLVALPGAGEPDLGDVVSGEAGQDQDYRAFREEGASGSQDYDLEECGPDCNLGPGTGIWLLHRQDWSYQESYESVDLSEEGTYRISLAPGWNLISNPFGTEVAWNEVQSANASALADGETLGPIYALRSGTWRTPSELSSAQSGEAFYLNNTAGLQSLTLPNPNARDSASSNALASGKEKSRDAGTTGEKKAATRPDATSKPIRSMTLRAYVDGTLSSRVELGIKGEAKTSVGRYDAKAPPSPFGGPTLRSTANADTAVGTTSGTATGRTVKLLRDYRPEGEGLVQFSLTLQNLKGEGVLVEPVGPSRLSAEKILLIERESGRTFNLKDTFESEKGKTPAIRPEGNAASLVVLAGTASEVQSKRRELSPDEMELFPTYPNPAAPGEPVTIEYTLPEEGNVKLEVYDLLGRRIQTVEEGRKEDGFYRARWQESMRLPSGTYFIRLRSRGASETQKVTLIR
ncbi:surface protein [Salinibacter ruber]|uniref:Surface protein n=1 Tax=Salinibacter ruber TaxID=146919 RepID=A0A9X2PYN9_9BACT|nr:FG-GAP-like repeat-containing protein [Salinibacter ruber]MCS3679280.1 surface protein [Salinibacter ruber]MCS3682566.1 surface protein [Salinibacter ruber]